MSSSVEEFHRWDSLTIPLFFSIFLNLGPHSSLHYFYQYWTPRNKGRAEQQGTSSAAVLSLFCGRWIKRQKLSQVNSSITGVNARNINRNNNIPHYQQGLWLPDTTTTTNTITVSAKGGHLWVIRENIVECGHLRFQCRIQSPHSFLESISGG